jgi:hypothetical protein
MVQNPFRQQKKPTAKDALTEPDNWIKPGDASPADGCQRLHDLTIRRPPAPCQRPPLPETAKAAGSKND